MSQAGPAGVFATIDNSQAEIAAAGLRWPSGPFGGAAMERDFWFYRRRASEETWAAKRAITPLARERHEALAQSFRERLERLEDGELLTRA